MLVFFFSSLAIRAVGTRRAAIIEEVRRQFRENPGIMAGTVAPGLRARASTSPTRAALREMVVPGIAGRRLAGRGRPGCLRLAEAGRAGFLMVGTIAGILMATVLNNAGGAWDNAKKFIEPGGLKDADGKVLGKGTEPTRRRSSATRRRPVQGHRRPVAARADQAADHDHPGAGAAVHPLEPIGPMPARRGIAAPDHRPTSLTTSFFQAIVIGINQGLTEFIPVSSSAHTWSSPRGSSGGPRTR